MSSGTTQSSNSWIYVVIAIIGIVGLTLYNKNEYISQVETICISRHDNPDQNIVRNVCNCLAKINAANLGIEIFIPFLKSFTAPSKEEIEEAAAHAQKTCIGL